MQYDKIYFIYPTFAGVLPVAAPSPRTQPTSRTRATLRATLTPPPVSTHSRFLKLSMHYPKYLKELEANLLREV